MKNKNYQHQSYLALSSAIGTLSNIFVNICIPIRNSFFYDLVGEHDFKLFRIKVIYTECKQPSGHYIANIRKSGGYLDKKECKSPFEPKFCDYLYVETPTDKYLIPSNQISNIKSITSNGNGSFTITSDAITGSRIPATQTVCPNGNCSK